MQLWFVKIIFIALAIVLSSCAIVTLVTLRSLICCQVTPDQPGQEVQRARLGLEVSMVLQVSWVQEDRPEDQVLEDRLVTQAFQDLPAERDFRAPRVSLQLRSSCICVTYYVV